MVERTASSKAFPVQLVLDSAQRIVTTRSETVLGWTGRKSEGAPHPLTLADSLLAPCPTSCIFYACNLPTARVDSRTAPLDVSGQLPSKIGRSSEGDFLAASLPGGQAAIIASDGVPVSVQFRWVCITAHFSIGAVWRCFARVGARWGAGSWLAIEHDYIFEAGGGEVLNPPGEVKVPCADKVDLDVRLSHPDGMLTCFPCKSGRVKITRLSANGWARRHAVSVMLRADDRVVALFSDGAQKTIAIAAPPAQRAARAA